jgi:broad specificity phosphatase PhoE
VIRLILVRHGQSTADVEPRCIEGSGDFPLTELGRRQANALGDWLAPRYPVDQIITSPLQRARETAQILSAATGAPLRPEQRLAERASGRLAGLEPTEADRLSPRPTAMTVYHRPPGGESYLDQYRRVADFYFRLEHDGALDGKTLVIVTHGGTLKCLLDAALGLPPLNQVAFACADTSLHELHLEQAGKVRLVRLNYTVHLEGLS